MPPGISENGISAADGHLPEDHGFDINIGGCQLGSPWNRRLLQPLEYSGAQRCGRS